MTKLALGELNPVRDAGRAYDRHRAAADLERIISEPRVTDAQPMQRVPHHGHGRRLAVIATAGCIALALVIGLPFGPWRSTPTATAATPPLLVGELTQGATAPVATRQLDQLATHAKLSAAPARLGSSYASWDLTTRVHGVDVVRSAVVPLDVTFEVRADGSQRYRAVYGTAVAGDAGAADVPAAGTVERDTVSAPGHAQRMYPDALPGDVQTVWRQLSSSHPVDQLGTAELFVAVTDLAREQTPGPQARSAVLKVLSERPDIRGLGTMTDRAGRAGVAFAVDSAMSGLPTRYLLIFEPGTGRLLASEQVLTTIAGRLDVVVPAVVAYTLFR